MLINLVLHYRFLFTFSKLQALRFYHIYFFELLDDEHGTPISQKNVKCNSPGLTLAIDPTSPQGEFRTLCFQDTTIYKPQNEIR